MKGSKITETSQRKEESVLVSTYPDYSSKEYWNARYAREKGLSFEWLQPYEAIREILMSALRGDKEAEILVVGCGNSQLAEKLYEEGYRYVTNIDFSEVVVEEMKQRCAQHEEMDFHAMDMTALDLDPESVQCIIDKAALDCVFCSPNCGAAVKKTMEGIYRALAPGGAYVCFSHGEPAVRTPFFQVKENWTLLTTKLKRPAAPETLRMEAQVYHYAYVLNKPSQIYINHRCDFACCTDSELLIDIGFVKLSQ